MPTINVKFNVNDQVFSIQQDPDTYAWVKNAQSMSVTEINIGANGIYYILSDQVAYGSAEVFASIGEATEEVNRRNAL